MTVQLQLRRGTNVETAAFTGAEGELTYDMTNKNLRIHDGNTLGGITIDKAGDVVHKTNNVTETISGTKTFSSDMYLTKNGPFINFRNNDVILPNANTNSGKSAGIRIQDKNGKELSYMYNNYYTSSNKNYSQLILNAIDPDTTHVWNRLVGTSTGEYAAGSDDWTNNVRKWTKNNVTYYTKPAGVNPTVGGNLYSNIACTTVVDTVAQVGGTRVNAELILRTNGTERVIYLSHNPTASNSQSDREVATRGWVNNPGLSTNVVHRTGDETIAGTKTFSNTIQGTANRALYADLAECYKTDKKYPIGTLIRFGGEKDVTIADINCNGVISDKPGYLLDYELEDSQPVALVGKTPVRVLGKIKKFDRIVLSEIPGIGKVQTTSDETPIAIALESSDIEEEKLVFCVTKFNIF